jgi:hypothetical protein
MCTNLLENKTFLFIVLLLYCVRIISLVSIVVSLCRVAAFVCLPQASIVKSLKVFNDSFQI